MHETTRQNNILDLVISTEEELILNLKITDKIGDHQENPFSIKTEMGNVVSEKNNYKFRIANFDAMQAEFDYHTFEQHITRNNAELGFEILKSRVKDASRRRPEKTSHHQQTTIHRGSTMMSNRLLEGGREPMKQKEGSTMNKLSHNT